MKLIILYIKRNILVKRFLTWYSLTMQPSLLAVFDFDHTITDANTDIVVRELLPEEKITNDIKKLHLTSGWTAYMNKIFELLHQYAVTINEIKAAITAINPVLGIDVLLKELYAGGSEIIIISDSNSLLIDTWLKSKSLDHMIRRIFTNPATINEEGMIKVEMYHVQDFCNLSTINLCKGHILQKYIEERLNEGIRFSKVAYVGDGKNDFCPILRLSENDVAFPRKQFPLMQILQNRENDRTTEVKAKIVPWSSGQDIYLELKNVIRKE